MVPKSGGYLDVFRLSASVKKGPGKAGGWWTDVDITAELFEDVRAMFAAAPKVRKKSVAEMRREAQAAEDDE